MNKKVKQRQSDGDTLMVRVLARSIAGVGNRGDVAIVDWEVGVAMVRRGFAEEVAVEAAVVTEEAAVDESVNGEQPAPRNEDWAFAVENAGE